MTAPPRVARGNSGVRTKRPAIPALLRGLCKSASISTAVCGESPDEAPALAGELDFAIEPLMIKSVVLVRSLVIAVCLAACGRADRAKVCQPLGDHYRAVARSLIDGQLGAEAKKVDVAKLVGALGDLEVRDCERDGWSDEMIACLVRVSSPEDVQTCTMLDPEQTKRWQADVHELTTKLFDHGSH